MRRVNLLPEEFKNRERVKTIRNSLLVTLGPTIVMVIALHIFLNLNAERLKKMSVRSVTFHETPEILELRQDVARKRTELKKFMKANDLVIEYLSSRFACSHILKTIGDITTEKVWLNKLQVGAEERTFQVYGRSYNTRLVSEFMLELKRLPYFETVELVAMGRMKDQNSEKVDFQIICNLK